MICTLVVYFVFSGISIFSYFAFCCCTSLFILSAQVKRLNVKMISGQSLSFFLSKMHEVEKKPFLASG